MSNKTGISWTDATWNPIRGCSRVSEGCRHCYAETQAARIVRMGNGKPTAYDGLVRIARIPAMSDGVNADAGEPEWIKNRGGDGRAFAFGVEARWTGVVRMVPEHLADPLHWRAPRRIFVNSMSDLFHEALTNEQIAAVFGVMAAAPQHTFQVLTKRAKRMREWFAWLLAGEVSPSGKCFEAARGTVDFGSWYRTVPQQWPLPNVWLGVSVENQAAADERIPDLLATPAAVRFLSCEPLIGPVDVLTPAANAMARAALAADSFLAGGSLDWLIAGCESGPGARPCEVDWLRSLRDQCAGADVPFFLKQAVETNLGRCGDAANPSPMPCGKPITATIVSPDTAAYACGCTVEGSEIGACVPLGVGDGSTRKPGGVIELPYLDGVQWAEFPAVPR